MLHIIFLSPHSDPQASLGEPDSGGQCIYEHELAIALSGLPGIKVTTFCRQNFVRPDITIVNNSYTIQRIMCGQEKDSVPKEELEKYLPEFCQKVYNFLNPDSSPDTIILHGHYWDGAYAALYLKNLSSSKLPFVWTPHSLGSVKHRKFVGSEYEWAFNFIPRQCWESYAAVVSDAIVLSTEEEKQTLMFDYAVPEEKIDVIAPGINLPQFTQIDQTIARKKLHLPIEGKILLCLGRMVKTKGYHHAIKAFAEVKKIYTQPVYLAIFGGTHKDNNTEESKYLSELKNLVCELDIEDTVIFHKAVDHDKVHEVFSAADIFMMSSEHEPFGLVTIEAMAMKLPVVAANSGGSVNIIVHNQTGVLVNYHHSERVATYLRSLLKDEPLHSTISEKAYKYVRREYEWYQKSEKFYQLYHKVSRFSPIEEFQQRLKHNHFLSRHFER